VIEAHQRRVEELNGERFELEPGATSLKLLQAIYRSPAVALMTRMRAAIAAMPFEHPKLAVVATVDGNGDFALKLDQAVERSRRAMIVAKPIIEANTSAKADNNIPSDTRRLASNGDGHKPSTLDRRYRRW
jgi:predicted pyridoxine 5'-phosphate oxidase superfamily flavin-nucleotide-binding protein